MGRASVLLSSKMPFLLKKNPFLTVFMSAKRGPPIPEVTLAPEINFLCLVRLSWLEFHYQFIKFEN